MVKIVEPVLAPGALILGDNVNLDTNHAYLDYIRAPENGYVSTALPLDSGVELAVHV
ncbi:hypothetical protein [Mycobacterium sherrisii]|uniref:hypothetical protein n=1 Tax=Mycobacterium sherrisii TaxID=243061 RepID=UPI0012F50B44|nr:hypothetical protein [Mycobacterium sherrisii]